MKNPKTLPEHTIVIENLYFIGMVLICIGGLIAESAAGWILLAIGFLLVIAAIVYRTKYYKCPHCGSALWGTRVTPKFCPDCGKKLD